MDYKYFKLDIQDQIAQVSFNRPEKSNALNLEAWLEMKAIFENLSESPETRVIILSGEGSNFCAGIDLSLLMSIESYKSTTCDGRRSEKIRKLIINLQAAVNAIEECAKPVMAAIHNGCIGGGVDIAAACDMRYCTEDSYFTIKEIELGMVADLGTLQRLPKIISPGIVAEMAYTGRKVEGAEALKIQLVNQCYASKEQMLVAVNQLAASIARKSPLSIRGTKEVLRYTRDHSVADGLNYIANWNAGMLLSQDLEEAFKATVEKRSPKFED